MTSQNPFLHDVATTVNQLELLSLWLFTQLFVQSPWRVYQDLLVLLSSGWVCWEAERGDCVWEKTDIDIYFYRSYHRLAALKDKLLSRPTSMPETALFSLRGDNGSLVFPAPESYTILLPFPLNLAQIFTGKSFSPITKFEYTLFLWDMCYIRQCVD